MLQIGVEQSQNILGDRDEITEKPSFHVSH
jgi:hypothetical protein